MNQKTPSQSSPPLVPLRGSERLKSIAAQLRDKQSVAPITVRELLRWFNAKGRGSNIVHMIRHFLSKADLTTRPAFEGAYIDSPIEFILIEPDQKEELGGSAKPHATTPDQPQELKAQTDPTYRIGKLRSANTTPVSVKPNQSVREAMTTMLLNDFSQLPVMTNERDLKGVISWISIGTRLLHLGKECKEVRECMDPAREVSADASLFDAIADIIKHQYVLIRDSNNRIAGIVTTSDLSLQFQQLAEPFLLLGEIENHIRQIIDRGRFTTAELKENCEQSDQDRRIEGVFSLTFGEYVRLLENPKSWEKIKLPIDKKAFVTSLDRVREIRNDVMHFDPDGVTDEDLATLRNFVRFLQSVSSVLATV